MKKFTLILVFMVFGLLFMGSSTANAQLIHYETLWAGQNINAGSYFIWALDTGFRIILSPDTPWQISESHVEIVLDPAEIPTNPAGNPQPGKFTWAQSTSPTAIHEYNIPYSSIDGGLIPGETYRIYFAIHAVLWNCTQEETAWGGPCYLHWSPGDTLPVNFFDIGTSRWGWFFYIDVTIPVPVD